MQRNTGTIDRILRVIIGIGLLAAAYQTKNLWFLVGLLPLFTGLVGFCPAYLPFGLSTCRKGSCCCGGNSCDSK